MHSHTLRIDEFGNSGRCHNYKPKSVMFIGVLLFAQFSCVSMCLCACLKCESCRQNGIFNLNGFYRIFAAHTLTCLFSVCNSVMSIEYKVVDLVWKISVRYLSIRVNVSFKSYWYIQQKNGKQFFENERKYLKVCHGNVILIEMSLKLWIFCGLELRAT